ncbi:MAG: nuclear transport factor 2 family protein [Betaproteobacteria bacterium]|nr:MAG: nuclear transport factor 2 family protein [Betaproteobacteria bacterium]TMG77852.1 MAG: nuclear transport factor 2 family protein [Betaproteobacteria bacterium]
MVKRFMAFAVGALLATLGHAATMEDEVRVVFDKYITAQNNHDLKSVRTLLIDSPDFLWITRGKPVWGREAALKSLEERYKGTWHIEPDRKELRVISVSRRVAQVYATTQLTVGDPGAEPSKIRLYINLVMVKKPEGWRIASILPILVPPQ